MRKKDSSSIIKAQLKGLTYFRASFSNISLMVKGLLLNDLIYRNNSRKGRQDVASDQVSMKQKQYKVLSLKTDSLNCLFYWRQPFNYFIGNYRAV